MSEPVLTFERLMAQKRGEAPAKPAQAAKPDAFDQLAGRLPNVSPIISARANAARARARRQAPAPSESDAPPPPAPPPAPKPNPPPEE